MFVTWFTLAGAEFPYQPLAVFPQFFLCFSPQALKPAASALSCFFFVFFGKKPVAGLSLEPLVLGFNPCELHVFHHL